MDFINNILANETLQNWAAAAAILVVGIIVSFFLRGLVSGAINRTGFAKRAATTGGNIGTSIGKAVFWLAILYTLYFALSKVGLGDSFSSVGSLFDKIAAFFPKLLGAGLTFFIGYMVARVAGNATTSVLEAAQVDTLAERSGMTSATGSKGSLAKALGTLVFVIIIVPVAVAALGALQLKGVSEPLSDMLRGFTDYIPALVGASLVLGGAIFIGRFISNFLTSFLPTIGFDTSVNSIMMLDDGEGLKTSPSKAAGYVAFLITLVIGLSAAVNILGNDSLTEAFGAVQEFGGQMLRAAVLIAIGVFLANFMGRFMSTMMNDKIANFVKYFVMAIFIFLGLNSLDQTGQIVPVAFSAFVIAASVAAAIAFGIGGRDWAGKVLAKAFPPADVKKVGGGTTKKAPPKRPAAKK